MRDRGLQRANEVLSAKLIERTAEVTRLRRELEEARLERDAFHGGLAVVSAHRARLVAAFDLLAHRGLVSRDSVLGDVRRECADFEYTAEEAAVLLVEHGFLVTAREPGG